MPAFPIRRLPDGREIRHDDDPDRPTGGYRSGPPVLPDKEFLFSRAILGHFGPFYI